MIDEAQLSVQDRDLLGRLSQYFDLLQSRLRDGQGWLIFNANRWRGARITQFIAERIGEYRPLFSSYFLSWRDFALNAYISDVELSELQSESKEQPSADARAQRELKIADRVSRDVRYHILYSDLFVLSGIAPKHLHEASHLNEVLELRRARKLPSILITPRTLEQLAADFRSLDPDGALWEQFFGRVYETSLIAL